MSSVATNLNSSNSDPSMRHGTPHADGVTAARLPNALASPNDVFNGAGSKAIRTAVSVAQMANKWEKMVMSGDVDNMMVHGGGLKGLKLRNDMRESLDSDYSEEEEEDGVNHMRAWLEEDDNDEDLAELRRQYSNTILLDESINDLLVRTNAVHGLKLRAEPPVESASDSDDDSDVMEDWLDADGGDEEEWGPTQGDAEELAVTVSELVEQSNWTQQDALRSVFARAGLDDEHQERIINALESAEYKQGEYIVKQGDMGDKFFIIEDGEVVITRAHKPGEQAQVVTHLYQGHFFGETSLRCREPRNANVQAIRGAVKVMFLSKERFDALVNEDEHFRNMIDQLVATKRETARKREELAQNTRTPAPAEFKSKEVKISKLTRSGVTKDRKQVINDYVIIKKLGKGAFGVVYLTFCLSNAALNAMKVVDLKLLRKRVLNLSDEEILKEAAVMKRLQHENLVGLFEVISDLVNDKLYLIQELIRGGAAMEDQEVNEPLPVRDVRQYFRDVLQAVHYLHFQGVAHRDLKPGNIMITDDGRAKIGDFGTAAILTVRPDGTVDDTLTEVRGTPAFLAPELYKDQGSRDPYSGFAVDMWALGVTLYNMVTGVPPFLANTELAMAAKILDEEPPVSPTIESHPGLRNLIRRMLEKDPKKRITITEALNHSWITDEGSDPLLLPTYERVNLKAEKLTFTTHEGETGAEITTKSTSSGAETGSLMDLVKRDNGSRNPSRPSSTRPSAASGAGGAGAGAAGVPPLSASLVAEAPEQPVLSSRASITEGIGVDDIGRPVNLGADIIPVNSSFDAPDGASSPVASRPRGLHSRISGSENSLARCATVDVALLSTGTGNGPRRTASSGTFRTAASMSIARGRSLEEATNTPYSRGITQVKHLRQVQRQILDNSKLTDEQKDIMLDRVRSETWFAVNPASSRIALEMLSPQGDPNMRTPVRPQGVPPLVGTIEEGSDADTDTEDQFADGGSSGFQRVDSCDSSRGRRSRRNSGASSSSGRALTLDGHRIDGVHMVGSVASMGSVTSPLDPSSNGAVSQFRTSSGSIPSHAMLSNRLSLRRKPDFVMVAAQDEQHGVIMRPHMNTFSVTGGARQSQLELKSGLDSSSDDDDFSDMEEAADLDEVFDPLSAPLREDEELGDLTPEEEDNFLGASQRITGGSINTALQLVCASAAAQGTLSVMEDRHVVEANYSRDYSVPGAECALVGVYDGHSGTATSQLLQDVLHKRLADDGEALVANPKARMVQVFRAIDHELVETAEREGCTKSGSTANVLFVRGPSEASNVFTLFCANAGDCRCVLSRGGTALAMSIDHKPSRPDEATRIAEAGGWVAKGRLHGVLAVSRAFGDVEHKGKLKQRFQPDVEFRGDPLIAEPEVAVEQLLPVDEFAIVGCDGLWDVITSQQAVNYVRRKLTETRDAGKAAQALVDKALENHTIDNVSVVLVCFQQVFQ